MSQTTEKISAGLVGVLALVSLLLMAGHVEAAAGSDDRQVRIAILNDAASVRIKVRGKYELLDSEKGTTLQNGKRLSLTSVAASPDGIIFAGRTYKVKKLVVLSPKPVSVYVDKRERKYRGTLSIFLTDKNKLLLVNTLGLDDYIRGVLYHEVSHRWPLEAIKAQAVAARSYAVYRMGLSNNKDFDVSSDIYSQVYGGRTSERHRTNLAVERTQGEVMVFDGKILPAYYHATCGGHTEQVERLWKHDLFALKGVVCPFCSHAPHYSWKRNMQLSAIQEKLNAKGHKLDLIKDIRVLDRNDSGRIGQMKITTRKGKSITIPGKDFRLAVGPNIIKSNNYRIEIKGYYADFVGRGWGHGVGMCQWGAMGMAKQRYDYREILTYYYPGVKIEKN